MASFRRSEAGVMETDGVQTRVKPVSQKLTHQGFLNRFLLDQCLSHSGMGFFIISAVVFI